MDNITVKITPQLPLTANLSPPEQIYARSLYLGDSTYDRTVVTDKSLILTSIQQTNFYNNIEIGSHVVTLSGDQVVFGAKTFEDTISASNLSGTNTGDQDLSGYALTSSLGTAATADTGTAEGQVPLIGFDGEISTNGNNATIFTTGSDAYIFTSGEAASISTSGTSAFILTRDTFKLFNGANTTTLDHSATAEQTITFPDATGTIALTSDLTDFATAAQGATADAALPRAGGAMTGEISFTAGSSAYFDSDSVALFDGGTASFGNGMLNLRANGVSGKNITLNAIEPTDDQTITFPDATGTVALTSDLSGYALTSSLDPYQLKPSEGAFVNGDKTKLDGIAPGATADQTITLSGDASGSGTSAVEVTLANTGVVAAEYNNSATTVTPFTVDSKGRITATDTAVTITPAWTSITSTPTTLSGYGITDAASSSSLSTHISDDTLHLTSAQNTLIDAITVTSDEINYLNCVTSSVQTQLGGKSDTSHVHDSATTVVAGFMSTDDKTKLDGIEAGATADQDLSSYATAVHTHVSSDITDATSDGNANPEKLLKTNASGYLTVSLLKSSRAEGGAVSATATSFPVAGAAIASSATGAGEIFLAENETSGASIFAANLTDYRTHQLPDASGTIALTSNLDSYATLTGSETLTNKTLTSPTVETGLIVDVDALVVDSGTGRVGIGTAAPSQKLDVVGNANVSGDITANGGEYVPTSATVKRMVSLTQNAYNTLGVYDSNTFYIITA